MEQAEGVGSVMQRALARGSELGWAQEREVDQDLGEVMGKDLEMVGVKEEGRVEGSVVEMV